MMTHRSAEDFKEGKENEKETSEKRENVSGKHCAQELMSGNYAMLRQIKRSRKNRYVYVGNGRM